MTKYVLWKIREINNSCYASQRLLHRSSRSHPQMLDHLGYSGILHRVRFVANGSLFITTMAFSCVELGMGGAAGAGGIMYVSH